MTFPIGGYADITSAKADDLLVYIPFVDVDEGTVTDVAGSWSHTFYGDTSGTIADGKFASGRYLNWQGIGTCTLKMDRAAADNPSSFTDYTISMWVYVDSLTGQQYHYFASLDPQYAGAIHYDSTAGKFQLYWSANNQINYTVALTLDTWHHIAWTTTGDEVTFVGVTKLYIDGVQVGGDMNWANSEFWGAYFMDGSDAILGGSQAGTGTFTYTFLGTMDDFAVWTRVLSATEIANIYNSGTGSYIVTPFVIDSTSILDKFVSDDDPYSGEGPYDSWCYETLEASPVSLGNSSYLLLLEESNTFNDTSAAMYRVEFTFDESISMDEPVLSYIAAILLEEIMNIVETPTSLITAYSQLNDGVSMRDALIVTFTMLLSEDVTINDDPVARANVYKTILDTLVYNGVVANTIYAHNLLTELINIADTIDRFFEVSILDDTAVSDSPVDLIKALDTLAEIAGINGTLENYASIFVIGADGLTINDTQDLAQVLQGILEDGLSFQFNYFNDGDTYTGWVMNTENFAVTNYSNYQFNSLAKAGQRYFGCKEDGVYLLEGNMDDSAYINAVIKSAMMDLGTSNLKAITQAYFGFNGDGDIVLKIITDDDTETWYTLNSSSTGLHTDRIKLAKGTEGRYWQFEITTQDNTQFDLDTIELFPIVQKRKL